MPDSTVPLSAKSLRFLGTFFLVGSAVMMVLRTWLVPRFYHDGVYVDFAILPALAVMAIGMGMRLRIGNDQRNAILAVASVLGGAVVLVLSDTLVAYGVVNRILEEQGEPGIPLLGPSQATIVALLQYYQSEPMAPISRIIGLSAAGYFNLAREIRRPGLQK